MQRTSPSLVESRGFYVLEKRVDDDGNESLSMELALFTMTK